MSRLPPVVHFVPALLLASLVTAQQEPASKRIEKLFESWNQPDTPGCVVGVIRDGRFVYQRAFGMADLEHRVPLTVDSAFYVGSMAKQFTAFTVFLLEEEDVLQLEDSVRKFVPEMPEYAGSITLRHLSNHTSGVRDCLTLARLGGMRRGLDYWSRTELLDLTLRQRAPGFPAGSAFAYSNSGYLLLAEVVERVTGESLSRVAMERIFKPLEMDATRIVSDLRELIPNRARGYARSAVGFRAAEPAFTIAGPGGLFTTLGDLLRWDSNFYEPDVGNGDVLADMQSPARLTTGATIQDASGLVLDTYRGLACVRHAGSTVGFGAELLRFPEKRCSIIVLANVGVDLINPTSMAYRIADIVLEGELAPPLTFASPQPTQGQLLTVALTDEDRDAFAGDYWSPDDGSVFAVRRSSGGLDLLLDGSRRFDLSHLGDGRFRLVGTNADLVFDRSSAGELLVQLQSADGRSGAALQELSQANWPSVHEFIGVYRSEELGVNWHLVEHNGKITVHLARADGRTVFPSLLQLGDRFTDGDASYFTFERDSTGGVQALEFSDPRVQGLRFEKLMQ